MADGQSNRELLSQIAFLADELLRASQEKVNLAQTNHESVRPFRLSFLTYPLMQTLY